MQQAFHRGLLGPGTVMNLILCESHEVGADGVVTLTDARAAHVRDVLRASRGDTVRVGVVDGPKGRAELLAIDDGQVVMRCALDAGVPAPPAVDLLLALPRPKVLRRLWAQLAALGVGRIVLTNAARVERHYFDTHVLEPATYRPLLVEGLQQAGDTRLPDMSIHRRFRVLIEDELDALSGAGLRLVAHPGGDRSPLTIVPALRRDARAPRGRARGRLERLRAGPAGPPRVPCRQPRAAHAPHRHRVHRPAGGAARDAAGHAPAVRPSSDSWPPAIETVA